MLLKVSDGAGGWVWFDNVDQVHLIASRRVGSREELDTLIKDGSPINLIPKTGFTQQRMMDVGVIEFYRKESRSTALFTNVAFICNDAGDTIERVNVGFGNNNMRKR